MRTAGGLEGLDVGNLQAGQRLGLEVVGRDERGQRQDLCLECLVRVEGVAGLLALADQHRVQDNVAERTRSQSGGHCRDGGRAAQHADLHGVQHGRRARSGTVSRRRCLQLVRDDFLVHGHEAVVPVILRVERDDAREVGDAKNAEFLERLQVGLGSGAAGRLRAGDGQDDGGSGGDAGNGVGRGIGRQSGGVKRGRSHAPILPPAARPPALCS